MTQGTISEKEWLTLKEASEMTGRSLNALRLLVHRKKIDKVRKIVDNGRSYWLIHKDTLAPPSKDNSLDESSEGRYLEEKSENLQDEKIFVDSRPVKSIAGAQIPLEHYEKQRKEWLEERDSLMQGLLMYRFKFEELEKQIKLLPAPPDIISKELNWKDEALKEAQRIIMEKEESLAESRKILQELQRNFEEEKILRDKVEERLKAELERERARSWWRKLLGI